jgi:ABC-type branched-subunit amino acid transport system substrate-binding protein
VSVEADIERRRGDRMAIAVLVFLVAAAVGIKLVGMQKEAPGLKPTELRLGVLVPRSGPYATEASAVVAAAELAVDDNRDTLAAVGVSLEATSQDIGAGPATPLDAPVRFAEDTGTIGVIGPIPVQRAIATSGTFTSAALVDIVPPALPADSAHEASAATTPPAATAFALRLTTAKRGVTGTRYGAGTYDAATAIVDAVIVVARAHGAGYLETRAGREAVAAQLARTSFDGLTGPVLFDAGAARSPIVWHVVGGHWVPLS